MRCFAAFCFAVLATAGNAQNPAPTRIVVNGVELHYISVGSGEPVVLLHGDQDDYRAWEPQMRELSRYYRVISYSRRYHFPNANPQTADHSAMVEAADLEAFIKALRLKRVNLVGTSMGAAAALTLAIEQPRLVRRLVIAEPPILAWAKRFPEGDALYQDFLKRIHEPARDAFAAGDDAGAMRVVVDGFARPGHFDALSTEARRGVMQNAGYFRMLARSQNPWPDIPRPALYRLKMPVLVVTGEKTLPIYRRIDEDLSRWIPRARSATIPAAGHGSPRENPQAFTEVVDQFLSSS